MNSIKLTASILTVLLFSFTGIKDASAQSVRSVEYYSPPGQPFQVGSQETAVVNSTGLVYSASTTYANRVAVINPNSNTAVAFLEAPATTGTGSISGYSIVNQTTSLAYFFGTGTANIFVVDGRSSSPTFNTFLPALNFSGQLIRGVAFDETRNRLYVTTVSPTSAFTGQINIIDANPASPTFHQTLNVVSMPAGVPGYGIAVNPVTNKIYVAAPFVSGGTNGNAGVYVLNGNTQALLKITGTGSAQSLIVNPSANLVYASSVSTTLFAIDGADDTLLTTIAGVPSITTNESLAINKNTGRIYAAGSLLAVIDGNRTSPTFNTLLTTVNIVNGQGIVVDENLNKIALALQSPAGNTIIVDGATNMIAATIIGQIAPSDVAINPATNQIFVANQLFNVQRISLTNNSLIATIPTGADAGEGVVSSLNNFYYSPRAANITDIPFFNANGIAGTVSGLPHNNGRFLRVVQNSVTNRLYAVNSARTADNSATYPSYVAVINPATNSVVANVPVLSQCLDAVVNEATNKVYVLCAGLGTAFPGGISVIDGATNTASTVNISAFPTNDPFFNGPIAANPLTNKIYIKTNGGRAGVINGATDVASLLPYTGVQDIDVNKTLNKVYFLTNNSVRVLDGKNDTEIANIPLTSIAFQGLAVNEITGRIFATNPGEDTVTVINANTNTIIGTVPTGDNPFSIAVNEVNNRIYVGNNNGSTLSLTFIDGNNLTVRKTLSTPLSPSRIAVSPATNRLYISSISDIATGVMVINDALSSVPFDFDGDGKSDLSVFRMTDSNWYINRSTAGYTAINWGFSTDKLTPADYDGDGKTDIAVWRPANGNFYIVNSSNSSTRI